VAGGDRKIRNLRARSAKVPAAKWFRNLRKNGCGEKRLQGGTLGSKKRHCSKGGNSPALGMVGKATVKDRSRRQKKGRRRKSTRDLTTTTEDRESRSQIRMGDSSFWILLITISVKKKGGGGAK